MCRCLQCLPLLRNAYPYSDLTLVPAFPAESGSVHRDTGFLGEELDAYRVVMMDLDACKNRLQIPSVIFKVGQNVTVGRGAEEEL